MGRGREVSRVAFDLSQPYRPMVSGTRTCPLVRDMSSRNAPHDNLQTSIDAVVLLSLLAGNLGLSRGGGSGGGAHRMGKYSLLKRVERRCCLYETWVCVRSAGAKDGDPGRGEGFAFAENAMSHFSSREWQFSLSIPSGFGLMLSVKVDRQVERCAEISS